MKEIFFKKIVKKTILLLLPALFCLGLWASPGQGMTEEQKILNEAWGIVNRAYVDESFNHQNWWSVRQKLMKKSPENRDETYKSIEEMLASLEDPFTRLLRPDRYRSLQVDTSGELTGVGLQIVQDPETKEIIVVAPLEGSPAEAAGITTGDRVLKIDDLPTTELSLEDAAEKMRGKQGTSVVLSVLKDDGDRPEDIELVRDLITINPVYAFLDERPDSIPIGYIRLAQFSGNATEEVGHAIDSLKREGAGAYILDLRNNPGGLLQAGIEIARLWLDYGTIVFTVNRQSVLGSFDAYGPALTDAPLVVLVNQGSASASEILAGALQDNDRALLVGEKTFGKGLIQSLFELSDGSALAVTVAKYETPNHTDINQLGIMPDKVVELEPITRDQIATEADIQYQAAVELLNSQLVLAANS
ncbi:MAG: PDZ domain-containing protein [Okeania sp. SIO2H7]|nr:PDZ domain-containing protein [Okeania sp. SIO2H7]